MTNSLSTTSFATYNVLNPFHAVKWGEKAGLSKKGLSLSRDDLKSSTKKETLWKLYSNWDQRCKTVSKNLQLANLICLQEVSIETIQTLKSLTKGYEITKAAYHSSSSKTNEFGNAIMYKTEKAYLKKSFNIQHITEDKTRKAACGLFEIDGKIYKVASVHLAGYWRFQKDLKKKQESKLNGFIELQKYVKELEKDSKGLDGIVIGGDFNEDPNEKELDYYRPGYLEKLGYQSDENPLPTEPLKNRRIDWLYCKPLKGNVELKSMGLEKIQEQASDHLMTGTVVHWTS